MSSACVLAEQIPVNLKADVLRYDDENKLVIASGNVRVVYEDMEIRADNLELDTETNKVNASGEITISRNGAQSKGAALLLDIKTKDIKLTDFSIAFQLPQSLEKAYMHADELNSSGNMYFGYTGRFTTCSLEQPHYWLSAKEFRYYPDEKIEGYHVFYNFSFIPIPVCYTPYYQFQLGKRKMILLMPVIGSNVVEGFFVRNEVRYFLDDTTEGSLYFDSLDRKGIGRGFKLDYQYEHAPGSFYLYNVNEKALPEDTTDNYDFASGVTSNYITKFRQKLYLNDYTELNIAHNYTKMYLVPSGRKDATDHDIGLTFKDDWRNATFQHRYSLDYRTNIEGIFYSVDHIQDQMNTKLTIDQSVNPGARNRAEAVLLTHSQPIDDRWSLSMAPRFYQNMTAEQYPDQRLDVPITVVNKGKSDEFYKKLTVEYNTYIDPDASRVTHDDHVEYVNKLPVTTLQLQTLDLDLFNVDTELGAGIIEESKDTRATDPLRRNNRVMQVTRYTGQVALYRDFSLPLGNTLTLKRTTRQVGYNIPGKHYRTSDQPSLKTAWWDHVEHEFAYTYTQADGESPIYYEAPQYDHENRLRETLRLYHETLVSWRFSGGMNYEIVESNRRGVTNVDPRDDFMSDLDIRPFGKYLITNFSGGWSYQQELWRDFVTAMTLQPNREDSWAIQSVYDFNNYEYKSASSLLKFHLGRTWWKEDTWEFWTSRWAFSIEHVYDYVAQNINLYTLGIYKDLHCWIFQFNYTKAREEWLIAFSLKAFPEEPLSLKQNQDGFAVEAFRKSLENPSINRY